MKGKKIIALLLALAMVCLMAACGSSSTGTSTTSTPDSSTTASDSSTTASDSSSTASDSTSAAPETLTVGMCTSMADIGPFAISSAGKNQMRYWTYEFLALFTEFGQTYDEMEWQLAKNIEQIDDVTYDIEIYDYITDAIGNPVTASDVAYSLNEGCASGSWPRATKYIESVTVLDDTTVEVKLQTTVVGAIEYVMSQIPIVSEKTNTEYADQMSTTPITTAAYQVTECVDGAYYVCTKNENYWQTADLANFFAQQPVETIKVNIITEASQAVIALQNGEVDMITNARSNQLSYFLNADGTNVEGFTTTNIIDSKPIDLVFNMAEGNLFSDNLDLRQAICYAINADDIVSIAYSGYATALKDVTQNTCGDFSEAWNSEDYYGYDLEKAQQLCSDAGYAEGEKDGQQVTIRVICAQSYSAAAQVVQAEIMALGFNVDLKVLDDSMFLEAINDPSSWDIWIDKKGNEGYLTGTYDNIMLNNSDGYGVRNYIVDDELQTLLEAAHNVVTHNEESIDALHYYVKDNAIAYGLFVENVYCAAREGVTPWLYPFAFLVPNCSTFS